MFHHFFTLKQHVAFKFGLVTGRLRAIRTILGTSAGFNRKQSAKLDFTLGPKFFMHLVGALEEIEKWQRVEFLEFGECHDLVGDADK